MPIDPSIALQAKPVELQSPLSRLAQFSQIQSAQNQNRLADISIQDHERELAGQNAMRDISRNAIDSDGQFNRDKYLTGVAQAGYGDKLPALQKGFSEADKSALELQKNQIEQHLQQFQVVAQIMGPVKDQATYAQAKQQIAQILGPEAAAHQPEVYDPAVIEQAKAQALTVKDQLEQHWKQIDEQLKGDQFAETKRHHRVIESKTGDGAGKGKAPAGYRWTVDGNLEPIPGGPVAKKDDSDSIKKVSDAKDVLSLLDEVDDILPKATGGYAGTAGDYVARTFGATTEGAKATAKLKALQGALVAKMPKMSGPQSDKDVLLYREMAGQVGDSTIPIAQRQAAAAEVRRLNEKYAGMQPGSSKKPVNDIHAQAEAILRGGK